MVCWSIRTCMKAFLSVTMYFSSDFFFSSFTDRRICSKCDPIELGLDYFSVKIEQNHEIIEYGIGVLLLLLLWLIEIL